MKLSVAAFVLLILSLCSLSSFAQTEEGLLDSLREREESDEDSVVATAKFIRYTNLGLLADSTQTLPIDTTIGSFQHYNPIYQPAIPTIGLGSTGLSYREMLFNPPKTIGYDAGFHALDVYLLRQDSVRYYRARSPFSELYYVNGSLQEQIFRVTHAQNIKPNWNFGANYFRIGSEGFYRNQTANHLNAAVFTWYESPNKRYNLLANAVFNTIKAGENGSTTNDSIFLEESISKEGEIVRLDAQGADKPLQTWRENSLFLKQFYYIGRIDSLNEEAPQSAILPTQRISHAITYTRSSYKFFRNEPDEFGAFPALPSGEFDMTNDSTRVRNLRNEFSYSFYLRGKAVKFIKNELKLDLGIRNDMYWFEQASFRQGGGSYSKTNFQNTMFKAGIGYRFSDRINIDGDIQQIFQGRNAGDFLYDAKTNFLLSRAVGRIVLGAYLQNKSPEQLYEQVNYQNQFWDRDFINTKITNFSFLYENPKFKFFAKAEYFLLANYLYYKETDRYKQIEPDQFGSNINLLKITAGKNFRVGKFNLESYVVYQKTDFQDILRTPEVYTYNSFYFANTFFKVLYTNIGFDVRFNTPFQAPAYAINVGQFYNDNSPTSYSTYPVIDAFIKANIRRANIFLKYDYANQNLFSKGFYTVKRYPMQDALLKFGVNWKFYD